MNEYVYIVTILIFSGILWNQKWVRWFEHDDWSDETKTITASILWPVSAIVGVGIVLRTKWETWDQCKECGKMHKSRVCSKEQVVLDDTVKVVL